MINEENLHNSNGENRVHKAKQLDFLAILPLDISLPIVKLYPYLLLILIIRWLIADRSQNENGSDYRRDDPINFESEMFYNTTSNSINKTSSLVGETRNIRTRRGEVLKLPKQNLSNRIRSTKNAPKVKKKSNFRKPYLYKIGTQNATSNVTLLEDIKASFQSLPPRQ